MDTYFNLLRNEILKPNSDFKKPHVVGHIVSVATLVGGVALALFGALSFGSPALAILGLGIALAGYDMVVATKNMSSLRNETIAKLSLRNSKAFTDFITQKTLITRFLFSSLIVEVLNTEIG